VTRAQAQVAAELPKKKKKKKKKKKTIFGPAHHFEALAQRLDVPILGRIPLEMHLSQGSDHGTPEVLRPNDAPGSAHASLLHMARQTWTQLASADMARDRLKRA